MLERYDKKMEPDEVIGAVQRKNGCTRKEAMTILYKEIPKEKYFQDKVKKGLKESYPMAFVRKISLGPYSQGGFPDILCILDGHYFGFEVKRPVVGELSALQRRVIEEIRESGGTVAVVSYPEEAIETVKEFFKEG